MEIVKALLDDDLVIKEKVGSGVFFWSFPAQTSEQLKRKLAAAEKAAAHELSRKASLEDRNCTAAATRIESDRRQQKKRRLQELLAEKESLQQSLGHVKDADPEFLKELVTDTAIAKEAANRWTDNQDQARKHLRNKYGCENSTINQLFGSELEYIE